MAHVTGILVRGDTERVYAIQNGSDIEYAVVGMDGRLHPFSRNSSPRTPFDEGYKVVSCNNPNDSWCKSFTVSGVLVEDSDRLRDRGLKDHGASGACFYDVNDAYTQLRYAARGLDNPKDVKSDIRAFTIDRGSNSAATYLAVPSTYGGYSFFKVERDGAKCKAEKVESQSLAGDLSKRMNEDPISPADLVRGLGAGQDWAGGMAMAHPGVCLIANAFKGSGEAHPRKCLQKFFNDLDIGYKYSTYDKAVLGEVGMKAPDGLLSGSLPSTDGLADAGNALKKGAGALGKDAQPLLDFATSPIGLGIAGIWAGRQILKFIGQDGNVPLLSMKSIISSMIGFAAVAATLGAVKSAAGHSGTSLKECMGALTNCFSNNVNSEAREAVRSLGQI